jgi:hypothetical protein
MKDFGWVTQKDGVDYYRSIIDPKIEVSIEKVLNKKTKKLDIKQTKLKKKIRSIS